MPIKIHFFVVKQELMSYTTCMNFIQIHIAVHFYYFFQGHVFFAPTGMDINHLRATNDVQSLLLSGLHILGV
jgi:hypothetical protein